MVACLSGGPDSVLLTLRLAEAWSLGQPRILVAHVNHGLRGDAAAADAEHAARLAAALSLPFRLLHVDPAAVSKNGKASEARLRAERYRLLAAAARDFGAGALYLGHQRDDRVEGFVLAALRGAGLPGLSALPRRRTHRALGLDLVRPLLGVPRARVQEELAAAGVTGREDASNLDPAYLRNRVRHELLPALRAELGGSLDLRLLRAARLARALARRAARAAAAGSAASDAVHALASALAGRAPSRRASLAVQRAVRSQATGAVAVAADVRLCISRGRVERIAEPPPAVEPARLELRLFERPGAAARLLAAWSRVDRARLRDRLDRRATLFLDADRVQLPLCARQRERGDRFQPLGHGTPLPLKRLLIARRIPRHLRAELAVFAGPHGIAAVEGLPPAARAALGQATQRVLRIRVRRGAAPR